MEFELGDVIVGLMMTALGVLGLVLAARAWDVEMYIFGLTLVIWALLFDFGILRRHYDRKDAARSAHHE